MVMAAGEEGRELVNKYEGSSVAGWQRSRGGPLSLGASTFSRGFESSAKEQWISRRGVKRVGWLIEAGLVLNKTLANPRRCVGDFENAEGVSFL